MTQRPVYPQAPMEYDAQTLQLILDILRLRDQATPIAPAETGYNMSNVTPTRTLDADSTTLAEVADVLATLVDDLKNAGYIG